MNAIAVSRSLARGRRDLLFVTLLLGQSSQSLAFTAFVAGLPQMALNWGVRGPFLAQMTMAVAALGMMGGSIVSGWVLERAGTRYTLVGSLIAYAITGAEALVWPDPTAVLVARFANGLAAAFMATACLWGISAEYTGPARARVLGISAALSNLIAFAGTLVGGGLAKLAGWQLAFIQFPVFGLLGCPLALMSVQQVYPSEAREKDSATPFLRRLLPFFLLATFLFAVRFMPSTQLPFVLNDNGIRDSGARALVIAAITVAATLSSFAYGPIQQRLSATGTFAAGSACMATGLAIVAESRHFGSTLLGALSMGVASGVLGPYVYHVVSERSESASRSRALGILGAFCFLGGFLNPLCGTPVQAVVGLRGLFLLVAAAMSVTALIAAGRRGHRGT